MKSHKQMVKEWIKDPEFKKAYDDLEEEFSLFDELIQARHKAGLTQEEVAEKMGTKAPAIARIESYGRTNNRSPSLNTLQKYADAVECELQIKLVPR